MEEVILFLPMLGGKKRSSFFYDIWNIKYLSKFKWEDLTEEIGMELCDIFVLFGVVLKQVVS